MKFSYLLSGLRKIIRIALTCSECYMYITLYNTNTRIVNGFEAAFSERKCPGKMFFVKRQTTHLWKCINCPKILRPIQSE